MDSVPYRVTVVCKLKLGGAKALATALQGREARASVVSPKTFGPLLQCPSALSY